MQIYSFGREGQKPILLESVSELPKHGFIWLDFTREEAARICGVSLDTIRRSINRGELRAKRTGRNGGGKYLVTEKALREWLEGLPEA